MIKHWTDISLWASSYNPRYQIFVISELWRHWIYGAEPVDSSPDYTELLKNGKCEIALNCPPWVLLTAAAFCSEVQSQQTCFERNIPPGQTWRKDWKILEFPLLPCMIFTCSCAVMDPASAEPWEATSVLTASTHSSGPHRPETRGHSSGQPAVRDRSSQSLKATLTLQL